MQQSELNKADQGTLQDQQSHNSDTQLFEILTEESEDQNPPTHQQESQSQGQNVQNSDTQVQETKERSRPRAQELSESGRRMRQSESSPQIPISLGNLPEHIRSKFQKFTIFRDQGEEAEDQTALPNRLVEEEKKQPEEAKNPLYVTPMTNRPPRHPDSGERGTRAMTSAYHTVGTSRGGLFNDSRPFFFHRLSNSSTLEDRGRQARVPLQKLRNPDSIIKRLDFDQSQQQTTSSPGKSPKWGHLDSRSLPR